MSPVELAAHNLWSGWRHRSKRNVEGYAAAGTMNA
jgi:hypothetical protein